MLPQAPDQGMSNHQSHHQSVSLSFKSHQNFGIYNFTIFLQFCFLKNHFLDRDLTYLSLADLKLTDPTASASQALGLQTDTPHSTEEASNKHIPTEITDSQALGPFLLEHGA